MSVTLQWVRLPGTAGNYISTPDTVANSITGDIDIRLKLAVVSWSAPASTYSVLGKYTTNNRSYRLDLSTGNLNFYTTADGTTDIARNTSASPPFGPGATGWIRVTLVVDNGAGGNDTKFYTSTDGATWTQLGSTQTVAGVTSIFDGNSPVEIGSIFAGATQPLLGNVFYAEIRNGINGTVVASFNANTATITGVRTPTTLTTASTGEVWTLNGTGWNWDTLGPALGGYGGSDFADATYAGQATSPATAAAQQPALEVSVAFTSNPLDANPNFVDITADMQAVTIRRGRNQSQLDKFQAGIATITLDNRLRTYDPIYTGAGAPYNGNILPMKRVRIRATEGGVTYNLFDGYADSWDQQYEMPRNARCILKATDGFKLLNLKNLPGSVWEAWIRNQGGFRAWYRLGEPTGSSTVADESANGFTGTINGLPTTAAAVPVREPNKSMKFDGKQDYIALPNLAVPAGNTWTIEAWIKVVGYAGTVAGEVASIFSSGAANNILIGVRGSQATSNPNRVNVNINGTGFDGTSSTLNKTRTHVMVTFDGTTASIYVNGSLEATKIPTAGAPDRLNANIGKINIGNTNYFPGQIDEVIIWDKVLTAADASNHFLAGSSPLDGQSPKTRIAQILDWISWPVSARSLDTGQSTLQTTNLGGTALSHLQKVEETEEGYLYMDGAGNVRFVQRSNTQNQPIKATFGDSGSELGYTALTFDYSDVLLRNEIRVTRDGGVQQIAKDTTSINSFGPHTFDRSTLLNNADGDSQLHAAYLLTLNKDIVLRVKEMEVIPTADPANLFPICLGADMGAWFTIKRRPQGVGSAITQNAIVQGIEHTIVPKLWTTKYYLSPIGTKVFWQLGVAGFSELGQTTTLGW